MSNGIQFYSTTPANNANPTAGVNMSTGSAPSTVHPSVRQILADLATWYAAPEWLIQADVPTYVSGTSFSVPGNRTAVYSAGRRVQAVGTGYTYTGSISTSAYTSVTTVTVTWDASNGPIDNTISQVAVGILQNQLTALPSAALFSGMVTSAQISGAVVNFATQLTGGGISNSSGTITLPNIGTYAIEGALYFLNTTGSSWTFSPAWSGSAANIYGPNAAGSVTAYDVKTNGTSSLVGGTTCAPVHAIAVTNAANQTIQLSISGLSSSLMVDKGSFIYIRQIA